MAQNPAPPKPFASVFADVDTSKDDAVAQAVADFLVMNRDTLTDDQLQELYNEMYDLGVPKVATPPPIPGFPSTTG